MQNLASFLSSQKNKTLLAIFPHPDDETFASSGLLLLAKKLGYKTAVLILTKGGAGQMHIHPRGKTIKQVREGELKKAVKFLKVNELILEDFDDGKLQKQESEWLPVVQKAIEQINPGIIVTFDPSGLTGHPDHISTSTKIFELVKKKFPKVTLLWYTMPKEIRRQYFDKGLLPYSASISYSLSLGPAFLAKFRAAASYPSQRFGPTIIHPWVTIFLMLSKLNQEWYHKVDLKKDYKHKFIKFVI